VEEGLAKFELPRVLRRCGNAHDPLATLATA
jgi:hypothetical protein